MYKLSHRSIANLEGVHPDLCRIISEAIKVSPIDFGIPTDGGLRTCERQREMYDDPDIATKCDGYTNRSRHQKRITGYGHAFDVFAYVDGAASWEPHHLAMVAGVLMSTAKSLFDEGLISSRLHWGGQFGCSDFTGWDMPHFEVAD